MRDLDLRRHWRPVRGESSYALSGKEGWIGSADGLYIALLGLKANLQLYGLLLRALAQPQTMHDIDRATGIDAASVEDYFNEEAGGLRDYLLPMLCSAMNVATPAFTSVQHLLHILRIAVLTRRYGLPRGLETFPRRLAERVKVRLGTPVLRLLEEHGRIIGAELAGSGEVFRADHVIVATGPHHAAALLPPSLGAQALFLQRRDQDAAAYPGAVP